MGILLHFKLSSSCFLLVVNNLPGNWLKPTKIYLNFLPREEPWKRQDFGCMSTACAPPAKPPTFLLFTI